MVAIAPGADARSRLRRSDRIFYTALSATLVALVLLGFARSWFLSAWFAPPPGTPHIGPLLIVHGLIFSTWAGLMLLQPSLVAAANIKLHRRIGYFGAGVAGAMVVAGNLAAIAAMHVGFIGLGDPHAFYAIPFFDIQVFGAFVLAAVLLRRRPEAHKRLMLLASTQVAEAALARLPAPGWDALLPYASLFGCDFVIVAGAIYDLATRGRVHPAWLWGGGAVVASNVLRLAVMHTGPWLTFARAMASLYWG